MSHKVPVNTSAKKFSVLVLQGPATFNHIFTYIIHVRVVWRFLRTYLVLFVVHDLPWYFTIPEGGGSGLLSLKFITNTLGEAAACKNYFVYKCIKELRQKNTIIQKNNKHMMLIYGLFVCFKLFFSSEWWRYRLYVIGFYSALCC